jgi:hypothetical protein
MNKATFFYTFIFSFVLFIPAFGGDYWAVIGDSSDTCFNNYKSSAIFKISPDQVKNGLIEYFQNDTSEKPIYFFCISSMLRIYCDNNYSENVDDQLIDILKWRKLSRENDIYELLIGQASKPLEIKLKKEFNNKKLSKIVLSRLKRAHYHVANKIKKL